LNMKRFYQLPVCLILVLIFFSSSMAEKAKTFDFTLPYPHDLPVFFSDVRKPYFTGDKIIPLKLKIDKKGKVKEIKTERPADSSFMKYTYAYLNQLSFEPALRNNKKSNAFINILLQLNPRITAPEFYFPVDSNKTIIDTDLYINSLRSNKYILPSIISYPSIFSDVKKADSIIIYPFVMLKVKLDKNGRLEAIVDDLSTATSIKEQVESALLYAELKPAVINNKPVSTEFLLLLSIFPFISYPTPVWKLENYNDMRFVDKYFIRILPLEVDFISKPIPKRIPADIFPINLINTNEFGKPTAVITIDTTGIVKNIRFSDQNKIISKDLRKLLKDLVFYPAIDREGKAVNYNGSVSFEIINNSNIRISYNWLLSK